ncbi:hypothetical protein FQN54_001736 [Arachnomyces sp. PD_36]|nr:hypothetical protein FQN54_001736 [Arachnomyces sp. PD_36]
MRPISSTTPGRQRRQAARGSCAAVDSGVEGRWETVATEPYCFPDISAFRKCQNFPSPDSKATPPPKATLKRRASYESLRSDSLPSFSSQFVSKGTRRLQLPSFDSLGIGSPSTDQILSPISPPTALPRQSLSFDSKLAAVTARLSASPLSKISSSPKSHRSSTLPPTPPAEDECVDWDIHSGDILRSEKPTLVSESSSDMEECTNENKPAAEPVKGPCAPSGPQSMAPRNGDDGDKLIDDDIVPRDTGSGFWLDKGIEAAVSALLVSKTRGEAVKVVSQTLPSPAVDPGASSSGHATAFTSVIQGIQGRLQPGQSPYINVTHAVPHRFSLSSLPVSPPSTPNLLPSGDDYFNMTVFSSATPVVSYHDFRGAIPAAISSFPAPIVPPYSVHIAVIERYLPPPSPQEYLDLFSHRGPSPLVDRLVELSPNGGSLILIYPTKQGALNFKANYLGPVLDPLLRQLVVVNELSADMGRAMARMASVSQMEDYETMKSNVTRLCQKLSQRSEDSKSSDSCSGSQYTLIHADKGEVHLNRKLWAEWYIQQETQRVREVLGAYWQTTKRLPSVEASSTASYAPISREVTAAMLLREILDGIRKRPPSEGMEPQQGVELGVFVIRRS